MSSSKNPFLDLYDDFERHQTSPCDRQKNLAPCPTANSREKLHTTVKFMLAAGAYSWPHKRLVFDRKMYVGHIVRVYGTSLAQVKRISIFLNLCFIRTNPSHTIKNINWLLTIYFYVDASNSVTPWSRWFRRRDRQPRLWFWRIINLLLQLLGTSGSGYLIGWNHDVSPVTVTQVTGDRLWTGKPSRYITISAFHPYGVDKSSTNLPGWGEGGAVTSVGWQITLCDPIDKWRLVVLRWISRRTIGSFYLIILASSKPI